MATRNAALSSENRSPPRLIPSTRFTLALLVFFAFIIQYSQRVNLGMAIVCMADHTKLTNISAPINTRTTTTTTTTLSQDENNATTTLTNNNDSSKKKKLIIKPRKQKGFFEEKTFHWRESQQQILLGAYWAGYIFTQIPGGWLATNIGAKWVYASSLGTSSLATLAMTMMYKMDSSHIAMAYFLRFITGLAHGVLFPATVALWSLWAVPQERSTLVSIGFCGTHLGTSLTLFISGIFCKYYSSGWMYIYITTGILGFIWLGLWIKLTSDAPENHKSISEEERDYITSFTGSTGAKRTVSLAAMPWKNIIKSKSLMALFVTHVANLFGLFFFLTNFSKLLRQLLKIETQYVGSILGFGFFLTLLSSLLSGIATDRYVREKKVTLTNARKISNGLTSFIPVFCMMLLFFCDESRKQLGVLVVLIFLVASGLGYGSGYVVNFADIVPAYSGVIFGIANTFASLAGLIGNLVAGALVKEPVLDQWRKLYVIFGLVYFIGGLAYVLFGSAVPRKWAKFQAVNDDTKLNENINKADTQSATGKL